MLKLDPGKRPFLKFALLLLPLAFLTACGGGGEDNLDDRTGVADPKVRFINAVPLSPELTLYRDNTEQPDARGAGYKFASKYYDTSTSPALWTVRTTSGNVNVGALPLDPARGNKYSIVTAPSASSGVELLLIRDPYNKGLVSDLARVRVLNASFNRSADLDFYLTPAATDIATVGPTFSGVPFKATQPASGSDSAEFKGGNYQLRITTRDSKTPIFSAPVSLADNADWLVLTLPDLTASGGIKVLLVKADDESRTTQEIKSQ